MSPSLIHFSVQHSKMKTIGVAVFVAFLITNSSASPILFDRLIGEHLDALVGVLDDVLSSDSLYGDILFPFEFESQSATRKSPLNSPNIETGDISDALKEISSSSKCTSCSQVSTVHEELPLPYIPNYSVVAAPFNTPGHQILGLLPKSEQITSKMLWIDDIRIPEVFQLVLAQHGQVLSKSFQPLVVVYKSEPLPLNARILSYHFPRLRAPGGFFNPINSHLLAIPFNFHQFSSASYLCLGLLNNFHPFSYALATQKLAPIAIVNSQTSQSSSESPVIELQQMSVRPIPAAHLLEPAAVDFVTPSSPLPLVRSEESTLIRSLERFVETQPNTPLFTIPENFKLSFVSPQDFINSLKDSHPIGLIPKSMALKPNFLPMSVPFNDDHTKTPWTEFQVVASMNSSIPQFFQPLIFMKTLDIDSFNNGVKLPIWLNLNEMGKGQSLYQIVLIRNPYEPMPNSPYLVVCMVPSISQPETISSSTVKTPLSSPDVLDNPAIHPRVIATSTSKPFIEAETTKTSIPAVKTSEPADRERRIETITPIVSQSNLVQGKMGKPLPSKKSWKNRLYYTEPSVKVIKREPSATRRSLLSYFGI